MSFLQVNFKSLLVKNSKNAKEKGNDSTWQQLKWKITLVKIKK